MMLNLIVIHEFPFNPSLLLLDMTQAMEEGMETTQVMMETISCKLVNKSLGRSFFIGGMSLIKLHLYKIAP